MILDFKSFNYFLLDYEYLKSIPALLRLSLTSLQVSPSWSRFEGTTATSSSAGLSTWRKGMSAFNILIVLVQTSMAPALWKLSWLSWERSPWSGELSPSSTWRQIHVNSNCQAPQVVPLRPQEEEKSPPPPLSWALWTWVTCLECLHDPWSSRRRKEQCCLAHLLGVRLWVSSRGRDTSRKGLLPGPGSVQASLMSCLTWGRGRWGGSQEVRSPWGYSEEWQWLHPSSWGWGFWLGSWSGEGGVSIISNVIKEVWSLTI